MKSFRKILFAAIAISAVYSVSASADSDKERRNTPEIQRSSAALEMAEGEVRKIDRDNKKITIRHGEIKNLEMPPMTMVFRIRDVAMLDKVQSGDKIKFLAEKADGALVVTKITREK